MTKIVGPFLSWTEYKPTPMNMELTVKRSYATEIRGRYAIVFDAIVSSGPLEGKKVHFTTGPRSADFVQYQVANGNPQLELDMEMSTDVTRHIYDKTELVWLDASITQKGRWFSKDLIAKGRAIRAEREAYLLQSIGCHPWEC